MGHPKPRLSSPRLHRRGVYLALISCQGLQQLDDWTEDAQTHKASFCLPKKNIPSAGSVNFLVKEATLEAATSLAQSSLIWLQIYTTESVRKEKWWRRNNKKKSWIQHLSSGSARRAGCLHQMDFWNCGISKKCIACWHLWQCTPPRGWNMPIIQFQLQLKFCA